MIQQLGMSSWGEAALSSTHQYKCGRSLESSEVMSVWVLALGAAQHPMCKAALYLTQVDNMRLQCWRYFGEVF